VLERADHMGLTAAQRDRTQVEAHRPGERVIAVAAASPTA